MKRRRAGFTLLEVLVASVIMAIAVAGLLGNLSTSLRNASRMTESDRATLLARRTMDELLAGQPLYRGQTARGRTENGGWQARGAIFEKQPGAGPGSQALERIELDLWWMSGDRRRSFQLEAFRAVTLTPEDQ